MTAARKYNFRAVCVSRIWASYVLYKQIVKSEFSHN